MMRFNTFGELRIFALHRESVTDGDIPIFETTIGGEHLDFFYVDDTAIVDDNGYSFICPEDGDNSKIVRVVVERVIAESDDGEDETDFKFDIKVDINDLDFIVKD